MTECLTPAETLVLMSKSRRSRVVWRWASTAPNGVFSLQRREPCLGEGRVVTKRTMKGASRGFKRAGSLDIMKCREQHAL